MWFGEVACRTTNAPPIPVIYLKDPNESDIKQFKQIWRANVSILLQGKHTTHLHSLTAASWSTCKEGTPHKKLKHWFKFDDKAIKYLKQRQHSTDQALEQELHALTNVLQFDFNHSLEQDLVTQAKVRLREIHDHEAKGVAIRHNTMRAAQGSKMTKGHFKQVKTSQHNPALSQMKSIMTTHKEMLCHPSLRLRQLSLPIGSK